MSAITILLVAIVALLAGMEGILDEFQFHQPLVACTLIGLVTGHLQEGILLGGSLQMMALGWANVGAAVAPDAALASVASSIIMVLALNGGATDSAKAVTAAIAVAVPLSVAGLFLTHDLPYHCYRYRSRHGRLRREGRLLRHRALAVCCHPHAGPSYRHPGSASVRHPGRGRYQRA